MLQSIILWGPPGTGKTTLARVIAEHDEGALRRLQRRAVRHQGDQGGDGRGRGDAAAARPPHDPLRRRDPSLQQGPAGRVPAARRARRPRLIGATTENPSFEVNAALLSRVQVFVLQAARPRRRYRDPAPRRRPTSAARLDAPHASRSTTRRRRRGAYANGDARIALNLLELAAARVGGPRTVPRRRGEVAALLREARAALRQERRGALQPHLGAAQVAAQPRSRTRRSTGSRACSKPARIRSTSRAGSSASRPKTSASPIRRRSASALAAGDATHFSACPKPNTALAQATVYLADRAEEQRGLRGLRRRGNRRAGAPSPSRCRCICATRPRGS